MKVSRVLTLAVALALVSAVTACGSTGTSGNTSGGATSSGGGNTITLQNLAFNPSSLSVKSGDTVTFKNADQVPHHIVAGTDDLGEQAPGESKTWTAGKDGTYMLKCLIHPSMQGQITVGAGGSVIGSAPAGGGTGGGTPGY